MKHLLSDVNTTARTATCAVCGPTRISSRGPGRWGCKTITPAERRVRLRDRSGRRVITMTFEEYDQLLEKQGGVCAICLHSPNGRRLCVDHDHDTLEVRGLLCRGCNFAIGILRDDPANLERALAYLAQGQ